MNSYVNNIPSVIYLYEGSRAKTLDVNSLKDYIIDHTGIDVIIRDDFIKHHAIKNRTDVLAERFARCRVKNLYAQTFWEPLIGEIKFEKKILVNDIVKPLPILYDGLKLWQLYTELLPQSEIGYDVFHIIFTNRLFGTFENDGRYHARVIICANPAIISSTGIVEAPAMPKDFYSLKHKYVQLGMTSQIDVLKKEFKGRFVDYDDPRLTDIMKGYVMQAILYFIVHKPFCENKKCRLYNAHWQEDLIKCQIEIADFCKYHKEILKHIKTHATKKRCV